MTVMDEIMKVLDESHEPLTGREICNRLGRMKPGQSANVLNKLNILEKRGDIRMAGIIVVSKTHSSRTWVKVREGRKCDENGLCIGCIHVMSFDREIKGRDRITCELDSCRFEDAFKFQEVVE